MAGGPPAVAWLVQPAKAQRLVWALAAAAALVGVLAYVVLQPWGMPSLLLVLVYAACLLLSAAQLRSEQTHTLQWDGEQWHIAGAEGAAIDTVHCVLDLQRALLLRVHTADGRTRWLWPQADAQGGPWLAFRRAVTYSSRARRADDNLPL